MKKRKRTFDLKEEYRKGWEFVKDSRNFIYIIIAVFFLFAIIGFVAPVPEEIKIQLLEFINKLISQTENLSLPELIGFIFLNNLYASFVGLSLGILFGIFPVIFAIYNGYILGFVAAFSVEASESFLVLFRLLPHGIFELPAVFISLGLGII